VNTLLIADDERTIREGIAQAIDWSSIGISRVLLASNGKKAYAMIAAEKPDIVIVDILMPEMTGMEIIAQCKKDAYCPEFVIISGHDEFKYAQEALKHHVFSYILKPCDIVEIADTVKTIVRELERRRSLEENRREMEERLETLMPQARERIFIEYLSGSRAADARLEILRQSLDAADAFQVMVLFAGETETQRGLAEAKRMLEAEAALGGRPLCGVMGDCLAAVFTPDRRRAVDEVVERIRRFEPAMNLRAAVSAPGGFAALPQLYHMTRQTLERAHIMRDRRGLDAVLEASASPYSAAIQKAMKHIEEHFADSSLSLGRTAKEVLHMNVDYVGKLFKKECGLAFGEYLMAVRMEQAKKIIASSDDVRIYEAAWQVGFGDDAAYFGQVFRKYTGVPPGEYRKHHGA
jgi:two-component system, response regulator YesN